MAMQQVNLYRRGLGSERANAGLLSARTLLIMLALVLATLASLSFYGNQRLNHLERDLERMRVQQEQQLARLELASANGAGRGPAQIDQSIRALTGAINQREQELSAVESGAAGRRLGFATSLEALARSHQDGLWLDGLALASRDRSLMLRGRALRPDLVPRYLEGLAREPALNGTRFGHLRIGRSDEETSVRFEIAAEAPAAPTEEES